MKSNIKNLLILLVLVRFVASFAVWQKNELQFDSFVFAQQWNIAECVDINNIKGEKCIFSPKVGGWTIHGLWPHFNHGKDPTYCNKTLPFNEDQIKDLEPFLLKQWPNMVAHRSRTYLWGREWVKHGTCGLSLPAIDTEHKFFKQSLFLNSKYNFTSILAKQGIVPSDTKLYNLDAILKAIENVMKVKNSATLQCIFSENRNSQALVQIKLCLSKAFKPISCHSSKQLSDFVPKWESTRYNPRLRLCTTSFGVKYMTLDDIHKHS